MSTSQILLLGALAGSGGATNSVLSDGASPSLDSVVAGPGAGGRPGSGGGDLRQGGGTKPPSPTPPPATPP